MITNIYYTITDEFIIICFLFNTQEKTIKLNKHYTFIKASLIEQKQIVEEEIKNKLDLNKPLTFQWK